MMFINKDLLELCRACSLTGCLAALTHRQLSSPGRDCMVCKAENIYHLARRKTSTLLWSISLKPHKNLMNGKKRNHF